MEETRLETRLWSYQVRRPERVSFGDDRAAYDFQAVAHARQRRSS